MKQLSVDREQYQGLQDFKVWCQQEGLTGEYDSIEGFRDQFRQHLIARVRSVAKEYGLKGGDVDFRQVYMDARDGSNDLPDLALDMLHAAAKDQNGVLIKQQFLNGFGIQAGQKSYKVKDHAAYAEFGEIFELLESMDLIRSANHEGSVYRLTAAGYRKGK